MGMIFDVRFFLISFSQDTNIVYETCQLETIIGTRFQKIKSEKSNVLK
jgi:hypothetical protein